MVIGVRNVTTACGCNIRPKWLRHIWKNKHTWHLSNGSTQYTLYGEIQQKMNNVLSSYLNIKTNNLLPCNTTISCSSPVRLLYAISVVWYKSKYCKHIYIYIYILVNIYIFAHVCVYLKSRNIFVCIRARAWYAYTLHIYTSVCLRMRELYKLEP